MAEQTSYDVLRRATELQMQCSDLIANTRERQDERWGVLRRVIENAAKQYFDMRIDSIEEKFRDQGSPVWLSVVFTVGMTLFPVSALSAQFLESLTSTTQKLLTRSDRALLKLRKTVALREQDVRRALAGLEDWKYNIPRQIQQTETMVAKFAKLWEPEVVNIIQDAAQELGQSVNKHLFGAQGSGEDAKLVRAADAPVVVVTEALHKWIDAQVKVENRAREMLREQIRDLFAVATSTTPAKEAKVKDAKYRPRIPYAAHVDPFPTTAQWALDRLAAISSEFGPITYDNPRAVDPKSLRDLQLCVESMIWASTYDFKPRMERGISVYMRGVDYMVPAPLPDALWQRLITRYVDPDEGKTYAEVGAINRLGTRQQPIRSGLHGPQVRLSHYFSQVLYPSISDTNSDFATKFRKII